MTVNNEIENVQGICRVSQSIIRKIDLEELRKSRISSVATTPDRNSNSLSSETKPETLAFVSSWALDNIK